jgi:hypothetical protein
MLPLLACCAGIFLGLHFNILALLPFSVLGAGAYAFSAWMSGQSLLDSAGILLFPLFAIQAGYMLGLTARETYRQLLGRPNPRQSKRI